MNNKFLKMALFGLVISVSSIVDATLIVNPAANTSGCCNFGMRGYWFETPEAFTLDSIWLNTTNGFSTSYNAEVLLFNSEPPAHPATTIDYLTHAAFSGVSGVVNTNIKFNAGDIIGFLAWDNNTSRTPYSQEYTQMIFGSNITLERLIRQSLTPGGEVSKERGGAIGAIGFSYSATSVPEPSTLAILGLGLMGLAARRFKKQA